MATELPDSQPLNLEKLGAEREELQAKLGRREFVLNLRREKTPDIDPKQDILVAIGKAKIARLEQNISQYQASIDAIEQKIGDEALVAQAAAFEAEATDLEQLPVLRRLVVRFPEQRFLDALAAHEERAKQHEARSKDPLIVKGLELLAERRLQAQLEQKSPEADVTPTQTPLAEAPVEPKEARTPAETRTVEEPIEVPFTPVPKLPELVITEPAAKPEITSERTPDLVEAKLPRTELRKDAEGNIILLNGEVVKTEDLTRMMQIILEEILKMGGVDIDQVELAKRVWSDTKDLSAMSKEDIEKILIFRLRNYMGSLRKTLDSHSVKLMNTSTDYKARRAGISGTLNLVYENLATNIEPTQPTETAAPTPVEQIAKPAASSTETSDTKERAKEKADYELVDPVTGQIIPINSNFAYQIMGAIFEGMKSADEGGELTNAAELAIRIYGENSSESRKKVGGWISLVNKSWLAKINMNIRTIPTGTREGFGKIIAERLNTGELSEEDRGEIPEVRKVLKADSEPEEAVVPVEEPGVEETSDESVSEEDTEGQPLKGRHELFDPITGTVIQSNSSREIQILFQVIEAMEDVQAELEGAELMDIATLAEVIYGENTPEIRNKVHVMVSAVRRRLRDTQLQLVSVDSIGKSPGKLILKRTNEDELSEGDRRILPYFREIEKKTDDNQPTEAPTDKDVEKNPPVQATTEVGSEQAEVPVIEKIEYSPEELVDLYTEALMTPELASVGFLIASGDQGHQPTLEDLAKAMGLEDPEVAFSKLIDDLNALNERAIRAQQIKVTLDGADAFVWNKLAEMTRRNSTTKMIKRAIQIFEGWKASQQGTQDS